MRFRVVDGPHKGKLTRCYGGRWDRFADKGIGRYVSRWSPGVFDWHGGEPPRGVHEIEIADQQLEYLVSFAVAISLALGGRRSGKSAALAAKAIVCALEYPYRYGEILSPTYRQGKNVWRHIQRMLPREFFLPGRSGVNLSDYELRFINRAVAKIITANKVDAARGEGVAWGGYDELQDIDPEAFSNAYLSTSEGEGGAVVFGTATIPDGGHRFYDAFKDLHDRLVASARGGVWHMNSYGNPFIDHTFLNEASEFMDADLVERELFAKWPTRKGRVYHPWRDEFARAFPPEGYVDVTPEILSEKAGTVLRGPYAARNLIALDPPWHAVVYRLLRPELSGPMVMHAIDEVVIDGDGDIRDLAKRCWERYPYGVAVIDPHDTKYHSDLRKYLRNVGYRVWSMRRVGIEYRVTAMRALMERGRYFVDPRCRSLLDTLEHHEYDKATGKPRKHQPGTVYKIHSLDHIGDAAGYGVYKLLPARVDLERNERRAA